MAHQEKMSDMDKDNYEYWKTITEVSMVSLGCWDAVDPGLTAAERARSEYVKLDNKARAYISRHVRPEYLADIRGLKTAKECWKALEEIHGRSTSMDIALCVRELGTIEKTPSMDILAYCGKIQVLFDKLSKAGIKFEDNVVASFILTGLATDPDYSTYVRITKIDKDLTSRSVKADLLLEEKRINAVAELFELGNALAPRRQWKPRSVPKQRWREAEEQRHK
ncbi:uncharacterized protein [Bombus flavifrons]|uniref:uncharacterized protein n=1 Tax=Bombus flavifrons TaxID=103934 RepID=UPI0037045174